RLPGQQQPCWILAVLPSSAEAANAPPPPEKPPKRPPKSRPAASAAAGPNPRTKPIDRPPLARLGPDIDQRGLAGFHHGNRFLDHGPELRRILDRPFRPPAHRLRKLVVLDVRVLDAGADWPHVVTKISHAVAAVGQGLHVHDLLVGAAGVEHH